MTIIQEHLNKALGELEKVAYGSVFEWVYNQGINRAGDNYNKQLAELCPNIFQEGWLACLKEVVIPSNHHAWSWAPPEVELMDPPKPYYPFVLPDFNEEKLLQEMPDEDPKKSPEVASNLD